MTGFWSLHGRSQESKKIASVTGATGAIGKAIVAGLAREGFQVILLVRNSDKASSTVRQIKDQLKLANLEVRLVDVSNQASIRSLAERLDRPLHVLINNATASPRERLVTPEGIELQFATNVLGYHWTTENFADILRDTGKARIINVASYWAGGLDLEDLEFKRRRYHNHDAYRQSKQADRMLAAFYATQFYPQEISVNSCHLGDVNSTLSNDLGFGGSQTPSQGARTPVWLAASDHAAQVTGKYFEGLKPSFCPYSLNLADAGKLHQICLTYGK